MTSASEVILRRVPYPYRAMMAISNDVDEARWEDFVLLHDFMNTERTTRLGNGLGLEIGDSFFFYATTADSKAPTFSYFEGCNPDRRAPWADEMDRLIEAGYLDCLHSWGEFSKTGGFRRELAQRAADLLVRSGRKVSVWINHGDAHNEQMAGRPGWDDPSLPHGHADLAIGSGLRYFWTGSITSVVGQNAPDTWSERVRFARLFEDFIRPMRKVAARAPVLVKFFGNRLMMPTSVCGSRVQVFQRYGFWEKPTAVDLGNVLSSDMLDQLEFRGGFLTLYTHLFRRPQGMRLEGVDWSPLVELARRHRSGRIQVTTTSRLLKYVEACDRLTWKTQVVDRHVEIRVEHRNSLEELQGVTFYVPDPERAVISIQDDVVPVQRHLPDHTGRPSISIPWSPLAYPVTVSP